MNLLQALEARDILITEVWEMLFVAAQDLRDEGATETYEDKFPSPTGNLQEALDTPSGRNAKKFATAIVDRIIYNGDILFEPIVEQTTLTGEADPCKN